MCYFHISHIFIHRHSFLCSLARSFAWFSIFLVFRCGCSCVCVRVRVRVCMFCSHAILKLQLIFHLYTPIRADKHHCMDFFPLCLLNLLKLFQYIKHVKKIATWASDTQLFTKNHTKNIANHSTLCRSLVIRIFAKVPRSSPFSPFCLTPNKTFHTSIIEF